MTHVAASRPAFFGGLDMGSHSVKAVVLDADLRLAGLAIVPSGISYNLSAQQALEQACGQAGDEPDGLERLVSTGYGRHGLSRGSQARTEILCHAKGAYHFFPEAITVVDIGGQDSKVIRLDAGGNRLGYKLNRKCAAGTGSFLETVANRLNLDPAEMNNLARKAAKASPINSFCSVFAASEVTERIRAGEPVKEIILGVFHSLVQRVLEMERIRGAVVLTGGVVEHNPVVADVLAALSGAQVMVPPHPQHVGALGAALIAAEK